MHLRHLASLLVIAAWTMFAHKMYFLTFSRMLLQRQTLPLPIFHHFWLRQPLRCLVNPGDWQLCVLWRNLFHTQCEVGGGRKIFTEPWSAFSFPMSDSSFQSTLMENLPARSYREVCFSERSQSLKCSGYIITRITEKRRKHVSILCRRPQQIHICRALPGRHDNEN